MNARKATYTSARARLLKLGELGPLFEGQHAMQIFGWDSKTTAQYMYLWSKQGLVSPLGGKSDVYFNLVADPNATSHFEAAVRRAMPGAVIGGHNVLHAAGLTTQRPGEIQLLARPDERKLSITGAELETRPHNWWRVMDASAAFDPGSETALARLKPGAALADSALSAGGLAPDDIDFDAVLPADRRLALRILGHLSLVQGKTYDVDSAYTKAWTASAAVRRATAGYDATRP